MIEFINRVTGTKMWVAEDRVEEYKAAGHVPAAVFAPVQVLVGILYPFVNGQRTVIFADTGSDGHIHLPAFINELIFFNSSP